MKKLQPSFRAMFAMLLPLSGSLAAESPQPVTLAISTNAPPASGLQLTPGMRKLVGSPFFKTEIDRHEKRMDFELRGNAVGDTNFGLRVIEFGASAHIWAEGCPPLYEFTVHVVSLSPRWRAGFRTNSVLEIVLENGTEIRAAADPDSLHFFAAQVGDEMKAWESVCFPLSLDAISAVGLSRSVSVRVTGGRGLIHFAPTSVNLGRIRIFSAASP